MALISEKNFLFILVIRNQDCSFLLLSIHQYSHRMRKAHMAHILRLFYCRHRIQYLLVHETAFFGVGIYRKVTTPKEVRFWKKWVPWLGSML